MSLEVLIRGKAIVLEGEMTIYFASEVKAQLLGALKTTDGPIVLDLSRVSELDTSGLQLLLMVRTLAAAAQRPLTLRKPSAVVLEVLKLCGLDERLGNQKKEVA